MGHFSLGGAAREREGVHSDQCGLREVWMQYIHWTLLSQSFWNINTPFIVRQNPVW